MKPDTSTLLDELTAARGDNAGNLIAALHVHRRRRAQHRALGAVALVIALSAGALHYKPREKPAIAVIDPPRSTVLTKKELLDSFGDQSVALVTWPDGRQQLYAISHRRAR